MEEYALGCLHLLFGNTGAGVLALSICIVWFVTPYISYALQIN